MTEAKKSNSGKKAVGAKEGAGYQKRREISLDDEAAGVLQRLGRGNLSAGVRMAAAIVQTVQSELKNE